MDTKTEPRSKHLTQPVVDSVAIPRGTGRNPLLGALNDRSGVALLCLVYAVVTTLTAAHFMGDTADYVQSVVARLQGRDDRFWEFGHILWRPLGWVLYRCLELPTRALVGSDPGLNVTLIFMAVNWLCGLVSVILLFRIVRNLGGDLKWALTASVGMLFTQGILNYSQSGCSYVPGLTFLLLGLEVLAREGEKIELAWRTPLLAGSALALSGCLWFQYVTVLPATLLVPFLLHGYSRRRLQLLVRTIAIGLFVATVVYGGALWELKIHDVEGLRQWLMMTAESMAGIHGVSRAIFGFARSFVDMGNDGMLVKRLLLHDPYAPVTWFDLLSLTLWKLAWFYAFLGAVIWTLLRSEKTRNIAKVAMLGVVPVLVFASFFAGGDIERYLPLYPFLFLALAFSFQNQADRWLKWLTFSFLVVMGATNAAAMARYTLGRTEGSAAARIAGLASKLSPNSIVIVPNWQDDLVNFQRSFPFNRLNQNKNLHIYAAVSPGNLAAPPWREDVAGRILDAWDRSGEVWISTRARSPHPLPNWNWVEGDDRWISWSDIYGFFIPLETSGTDGEDTFALLLPSSANRIYLMRFSEPARAEHGHF